ncbi:hypothetical protein HN371_22980 [Candidatus Poribacteria bacterium]|jgi:pyruvate-formate lyase|nr:hypothetical protein [Candidatus Poribacteria bacterium]MBT5532991.1 hypothetical protein [Candidatus Poribacteria bacterium]
MAIATPVSPKPTMDAHFSSVREQLFENFARPDFRPETGVDVPALRAAADEHVATQAAEPRVLIKARLYELALERGRIAVDPLDWFADKVDHGAIVRRRRDAWHEEARAGVVREEAAWLDHCFRLGLVKGGLDMGHISPGWERMFAGGLMGLMESARENRHRLGADATPEQVAFYDAIEIVYGATIRFSERLADLADALVAEYPQHESRLRAVAAVCRRVPARAPRRLHEALQFAWLMHEMIEMEGEHVRSAGHFDRIFAPYYHADIDSGRLTRDQAKELVKFFWHKHYARTRGSHNGKNFVFGGQDAAGVEVANDLTFLAFEAYEDLNTPDPKLSVRFTPDTPDRVYRRVADLIRRGHNSFVLMNDAPVIEGLVKRGKTLEDARSYLPIGCYEPAVDGKEVGCTMNIVVNLAKAFELALHDGVDPLSGERVGPRTGDPEAFTEFEQLQRAYERQLEFVVTRAVEYVAAHERAWPVINPSPLIAGTIDDCIAEGKDIGEGGARYNSVGCVGVALANTCDALLGVKHAVFDERRFTMRELLDAVRDDFDGREPMRLYLLNRVPKWGNGIPDADVLGKSIADHYCATVHSLRNGRGGPVQAALFTLDYRTTMGRRTGALPDGRHACTPLAPGVGAMSGRDRNGVTALLGSVSALDFTETPNGSVVDVTLHPTSVAGEAGLDAMVSLIKTFFARGGYALQCNVFDADMLRDAQRHPERYASLQIRVTGWSVYFNTLSKAEQDGFIERIAHHV